MEAQELLSLYEETESQRKELEERVRKLEKEKAESKTVNRERVSDFAGMCEELGFSENRDSSALDDGYKAGLRDNVEYQAGLREGAADGTSQGTVDGTRSGNRDGRQDGFDDGAADGKADAEQLAYEDCYDAAYPAAYAEAFDLAYLDAYWLAYDQAYVDEYDAVMVDYYETQDCEVVLFGG